MIATSLSANGQEMPPRPITVTVSTVQNLSFGAFYHIGTGSVIIYTDGSRSSTGGVVLLGMGYTFNSGLYDVVANRGTLITIVNGSDVWLPGSNGGSMLLHIETSDPVSPFIITTTPPTATQVRIGGTLTVGNAGANPPGNYSGTFNVTFFQQ